MGREEQYECPNVEHSEGYCKFHYKEYAADEKNKEELLKLLSQMITKANENEKGSR